MIAVPLELRPFGRLRIFPDYSSQSAGPLAFRSASRLAGGYWENELFGRADFRFGMGSYLQGPAGDANVAVRASLECESGALLYIEYTSRGQMPSHSVGNTPVMLAGQIECDPTNPKYAWLNRTHVVGRGMLTADPDDPNRKFQDYEMYVLVEAHTSAE